MTQMMKNSIPWPTIMVVVSWYTSNIGVLLMNKYLLTNYGYKYPVFLTMCHMMLCSVFSYVGISVLDIVPLQSVQSKNQLLKICGLSVVFCFSVVCGNVSLNYIPVSFNQAIGATTPFFTAVFAYAVSRKREAWVTYCTLLPVVAGVIIASGVNNFSSSIFFFYCIFRYLCFRGVSATERFLIYAYIIFLVQSEPSFHLFGFIICVASTAARAFKSVLQSILLSSEG